MVMNPELGGTADRIVFLVDGRESKNLEEDRDVQRAGFQGDGKKKKKKKKKKAWLFLDQESYGNGAEEERRFFECFSETFFFFFAQQGHELFLLQQGSALTWRRLVLRGIALEEGPPSTW